MSGPTPFGQIMEGLRDVELHLRCYRFDEAREAMERLTGAIDTWQASEAVSD